MGNRKSRLGSRRPGLASQLDDPGAAESARAPRPLSRWHRSERVRTSMVVVFASREFSMSSLTAVARSNTTCPEQMRCTDAASMRWIEPRPGGPPAPPRRAPPASIAPRGCANVASL